MFHPGNLHNDLRGSHGPDQQHYLRQHENQAGVALAEAWAWLHAQGLVVAENGTKAL